MNFPRKLLALALVVLVLAIGAVGWLCLRPHGPTDFAGGARVELADYRGGDPTGAPPSIAGTDMMARGEYLTRAADCVACHTAPDAGLCRGMAFPLPFGSPLYSTNITPDKDTGIGAWSGEDFVGGTARGRRPGRHASLSGFSLYLAHPHDAQRRAGSQGLSVQPQAGPEQTAGQRHLISIQPALPHLVLEWAVPVPDSAFSPTRVKPPNGTGAPISSRRSAIAANATHPRNLLYGLSPSRKFAGAIINGWKAYSITSGPRMGHRRVV